MQIYNSHHYTTKITNNNRYFYYDGLRMPVSHTMSHLHNHLRQWYGNSTMPPALQNESPTVHTPYNPQQTDGWSCTMYMLLTSPSTIYQGQIPILHYGQRHVDQLSILHLRYVLTGENTPWIDTLITYIIDPLNNEDPEPHGKHIAPGV